MRLSDYDRTTGQKWSCAFCGSESGRPCAFHRGNLERLIARRSVVVLGLLFLVAAVSACVAIYLGDAS